MQGKVKWFDKTKGFGFITTGTKDIFVHYKSIISRGFASLEENQEVTFDVETTQKGDQATNVQAM